MSNYTCSQRDQSLAKVLPDQPHPFWVTVSFFLCCAQQLLSFPTPQKSTGLRERFSDHLAHLHLGKLFLLAQESLEACVIYLVFPLMQVFGRVFDLVFLMSTKPAK